MRRTPHVAFGARVRSTGPQRHHRIDDKRQRLVIDLDLLDRVGRRHFVDRRDRDDRLALIERLGRERHFRKRVRALRGGLAELHRLLRLRNVLAGDDRDHAGHRQRGARVDAADAGVRQRAQQQLREQHAVGAEVFGVLRAAGDLRDQIGQHIVLPDSLYFGFSAKTYALRMFSAPRIIAFRILL